MSLIVEEDPLSRVSITLSERGFLTVVRFVAPATDVQTVDFGTRDRFEGSS